MFKKPIYTLGVIVVIVLLAGAIIWPGGLDLFDRDSFKLGLDLKGGAQLIYSLDVSNIDKADENQAVQGVIDVLNKRINTLGVSEPVIQSTKVGDKPGVLIELPGVTDVNHAKELIGQTAQLKFQELNDKGQFVDTGLTGAHLKKADATYQGNSKTGGQGFQGTTPVIELTFNKNGAELFKQITARNLQKPVAIILDNQTLSSPTVQTTIENGQAVITGIDNIQEAKNIATLLQAGALPVPIELASENQIGATLGQDSIQSSLVAGLLGVILIAIFMIVYYRRAGLFAIIALGVYTIITLAVFKLIPITLTLAGIAGFIFSVGVAVDANVLVFERFKEELRAGKVINIAIEESFKRSWSSIWPSNTASLITAVILYYGTTGLVRGFAVTLAVGILVSLFTAITFTRTLLRLFGKNIKRVTL